MDGIQAIMNTNRKRISGRLEQLPRGYAIVTDAGDHWVLEDVEPIVHVVDDRLGGGAHVGGAAGEDEEERGARERAGHGEKSIPQSARSHHAPGALLAPRRMRRGQIMFDGAAPPRHH